jgi:hypothetical protein
MENQTECSSYKNYILKKVIRMVDFVDWNIFIKLFDCLLLKYSGKYLMNIQIMLHIQKNVHVARSHSLIVRLIWIIVFNATFSNIPFFEVVWLYMYIYSRFPEELVVSILPSATCDILVLIFYFDS